MNASNDDLDLKSLWQDTAAPDVDDLINSVRKSRARMWQLLAVELVGTIGALIMMAIYTVWGVFGDRYWFPVGLSVVAVGVQAWTWRWRAGLWHALSDAPIDLLKLQRKRTLMNLKLARYYFWGTPICLLLGLAFAFLAVDDGFSAGFSEPVRVTLLISVSLLALLTIIYGGRMTNRCKRDLILIDARINEFEGNEK
ncbi:MAG: hypothetical protein AB8G17_00565 [Gammaproteobacteria bacterium]